MLYRCIARALLIAAWCHPLLCCGVQYRMHPGISAWPSSWFYGGRLKDGVSAADKPAASGLPWPDPDCPVAVVDVSHGVEERSTTFVVGDAASRQGQQGRQGREQGEVSYRNLPEAAAALKALYALAAAGEGTRMPHNILKIWGCTFVCQDCAYNKCLPTWETLSTKLAGHGLDGQLRCNSAHVTCSASMRLCKCM